MLRYPADSISSDDTNSFKTMPNLDSSLWGSAINNVYQNTLRSINVFKGFTGNITIEN